MAGPPHSPCVCVPFSKRDSIPTVRCQLQRNPLRKCELLSSFCLVQANATPAITTRSEHRLARSTEEPVTMNAYAIVLLIAALLLQTGCQSQIDKVSSQNSSPDATAAQASADRELVKDVERFASGDNSEASAAWQNLVRRDRQKLISGLSRISNALPADHRNRVFIAYTFCKMDHEYDTNKKVMLSALSKNPPYRDLYGDWVAGLMGSLFIDGHKDLMAPLFHASEWSDGAMSTELAGVYSQALLMDAQTFVETLTVEPENTRNTVIRLLHDHSLTAEQNEKVKAYLKTVVSSSKQGGVAAEILKTLSKP